MRDSGRASLSQPRWMAHATAAGGVSERNPAKSPIRNANNSVIYSPKISYADPRQWFSQLKYRKKITVKPTRTDKSMHCLVYKREVWKLPILFLALLISISACGGSRSIQGKWEADVASKRSGPGVKIIFEFLSTAPSTPCLQVIPPSSTKTSTSSSTAVSLGGMALKVPSIETRR